MHVAKVPAGLSLVTLSVSLAGIDQLIRVSSFLNKLYVCCDLVGTLLAEADRGAQAHLARGWARQAGQHVRPC
jgi:hypothetical protein